MNRIFLLSLAVLTSILISIIGFTYSPIYEYGTLQISSGLSSDAVIYYLALLIWALTPFWICLAFVKNYIDDLNKNSVSRIIIIFTLILNLAVVSYSFWTLVITSPQQYIRYFLLMFVTHLIILIIWNVANYQKNIASEFITSASVGSARKENLSKKIELTSEIILQNLGNSPLRIEVKKQIDLLQEDIRLIPNFISQDAISKLVILVDSWAEDQKLIFSNQANGLDIDKNNFDVFNSQTKALSKKISQLKN
jgi:hypothetical protein